LAYGSLENVKVLCSVAIDLESFDDELNLLLDKTSDFTDDSMRLNEAELPLSSPDAGLGILRNSTLQVCIFRRTLPMRSQTVTPSLLSVNWQILSRITMRRLLRGALLRRLQNSEADGFGSSSGTLGF